MLKGKTALVTGGSRGIGKAIVLKMAEQGANVAVVYSAREEAAAEVSAQAKEYGVEARIYRCDVAEFGQVAALIPQVIEDFGGIDILVNNAGIVRDGLVLSMSEGDFDQVIGTNLKGTFNMIKHTYTHFMKKRSGRIINISSVIGIMGNAGQANYASAKAGIIGLTKSVARELAGRGVTCNAIAPGFIQTDMTAELSERIKDNVLQAVPMKKMGSPDDVAGLAAFLASDQAAYITGEVIKVAGGLCI